MINYETFELDNGLKLVVHKDRSTPLVAVNILYRVGSRDEHPERTGFAHLFEHLMFGGSVNIPKYDEPLEKAGGENNAFTNNDITNYYLTAPYQNIETAFWLESDRMLALAFSEKSLKVQKNVVVEEFKQRYSNQPYGDIWHLLRPLAYKTHPYRWPAIGRDISHIQNAKMEDVKEFFYKYYSPNNAILAVAGNVDIKKVTRLAEKWFGSIPKGGGINHVRPAEPEQNEARNLTVHKPVPYDVIYRAYHMCSRTSPEYHATDLLSDVLSNGESSRFHQNLVKEKKLFSTINAFLTGDADNGLFVIAGYLMDGVSIESAQQGIDEEVDKIKGGNMSANELQKVKNKIESNIEFSEINLTNRAMHLAYAEFLGDISLINKEKEKYRSITMTDIRKQARTILKPENCSTLFYLRQK